MANISFDNLFYRAPQQGFDFSPLERGGAAMGDAYAQIGQAIGAGLIEAQRRREREQRQQEAIRQFNVQQSSRQMLYDAQLAREKRLMAQEEGRAAREEARMGLAERREQRMEDASERAAAKEEAAVKRQQMIAETVRRGGDPLSMLPFARTGAEAVGIMQTAAQMQASRERATAAEAQRQRVEEIRGAAGPMLSGYVKGGIIPKEMEPILRQKIQLDPEAALSDMLKTAGEYANEQYDVGLIDRKVKEFGDRLKTRQKERDEALKAGLPATAEVDEEAWKELAALEATALRGPRLASEIQRISRVVEGVKPKTTGRQDKPKVLLPTGRSIDDTLGLAAGGDFESMTRQQREGLFALGRSVAQDDKSWPTIDGLRQVLQSQDEGLSWEAATQRAALLLPELQQNVAISRANEIAALNGWHAGQTQAVAPQSAPAPSGPVTIESLKQRAIAEGWSKEQFFEEARKAGIK